MKTRTLLVDSSYLLKRSVNGAKDAYTDKFGHIGGLYSFITSVRKLVKDHKINKVVLSWDGQNGGLDRYYIDKEYKANRKDKSWSQPIVLSEADIRKEKRKTESILKQRQRIKAYAEELFFRQIEVDTIEADDIIAAYCQSYCNEEDIYLFSNDRDFAQLLYLDITIIFSNIDGPVTRKNFFYHFNYHYSNALTMKIICGDVSDNIKGIELLKEKTLMKHFPEMQFKHMSVKDVCKGAAEINKQRVEEKKKPLKALQNILENIDRLKINYRLINLEKPFLNDEAIEELEQLKMPLSPDGRGSKYLHKMMKEDEFLTVYTGTFVNYIEPFYTIIMNEKQILKNFYKNRN